VKILQDFASVAAPVKRTTSQSRENVEESDRPRKIQKTSGRVRKGLRHFSIQVCEKLRQKGSSTYNDIANLLVEEAKLDPIMTSLLDPKKHADEEKNIRRRIYDALNVLMAVGVIQRDNKLIVWKGVEFAGAGGICPGSAPSPPPVRVAVPIVSSNVGALAETRARIHTKKGVMEDAALQFIGLKTLIARHQVDPQEQKKLHPPFVVVDTARTTNISGEVSEDRQEMFVKYSDAFIISDDQMLLKTVGSDRAVLLQHADMQPLLPSLFPERSAELFASARTFPSLTLPLKAQDASPPPLRDANLLFTLSQRANSPQEEFQQEIV
jgi:hypothetical protein